MRKFPFAVPFFVCLFCLSSVVYYFGHTVMQSGEVHEKTLKDLEALAGMQKKTIEGNSTATLQTKESVSRQVLVEEGIATLEGEKADLSLVSKGKEKKWQEKIDKVLFHFQKAASLKQAKGAIPSCTLSGTSVCLEGKGLHFEDPEGTFEFEVPLHFKGKKLVWSDSARMIALEGASEILLPGLASIQAKNGIVVTLDPKKNDWISLETKEDVHLRYVDATGAQAFLFTDGRLFFDRKGNLLILEKGSRPVHFFGPFGEIYADRVALIFESNQKSFSPMWLQLDGNVSVTHRAPPADPTETEPGMLLHYVLCDRLEGNFSSQVVDLLAFDPNRVLLFDAINSCEMSAQAFQLTLGKKEKVEGRGDVHLRFSQEEIKKMQSAFKGIRYGK